MSAMRSSSWWQGVVVVVLVAGLAVPRTALAAVETGAESPQALVARLQKAAETEDFAELAACLAPEDRAMMSMMLMLASGMMVAFAGMGGEMASGMAEAFGDEGLSAEDMAELEAEKATTAAEITAMQERYEAILAKYGVDELMEEDAEPTAEPGPAAAAELLAEVDQVGLVADLMRFMRESFPDEAGEEQPVDVPMGELADLRIDGDQATATLGGEPARFVRIDGRWYAAMEPEGGAGDPSGAEPAAPAP